MIINNEKRKVKSSESWGLERAVAKELREKRGREEDSAKGNLSNIFEVHTAFKLLSRRAVETAGALSTRPQQGRKFSLRYREVASLLFSVLAASRSPLF